MFLYLLKSKTRLPPFPDSIWGKRNRILELNTSGAGGSCDSNRGFLQSQGRSHSAESFDTDPGEIMRCKGEGRAWVRLHTCREAATALLGLEPPCAPWPRPEPGNRWYSHWVEGNGGYKCGASRKARGRLLVVWDWVNATCIFGLDIPINVLLLFIVCTVNLAANKDSWKVFSIHGRDQVSK